MPRAGLIQPSDARLHALRQIVCHLLIRHFRELIAYGAGWTDPERQRPGATRTPRAAPSGRDHRRRAPTSARRPRPAPRDRAADRTARAPAFTLDPAGSKALGAERMARKRRDALPGGESSLRNAVSEFTRPMLSPGLAALNHDAFVLDDTYATSVDLATHCPASSLDDLVDLDLDLGSRRARQPSRVVRTHSVTPAQAANGTGRGTAAATGQRVLSFFA